MGKSACCLQWSRPGRGVETELWAEVRTRFAGGGTGAWHCGAVPPRGQRRWKCPIWRLQGLWLATREGEVMEDADSTVQLDFTMGTEEARWPPGHGELALFSAASPLRCSGSFCFSPPCKPHVLLKTTSYLKLACICISSGVF